MEQVQGFLRRKDLSGDREIDAHVGEEKQFPSAHMVNEFVRTPITG